ncbi:hypothetical protein ACFL1X_13835 [Candidatus Hydrogenedentota bacterium]
MLSVNATIPGGEWSRRTGIAAITTKPRHASILLVRSAARYVNEVALQGADVTQARRYVKMAKQYFEMEEDMAAMTAARTAIFLARSVLQSGESKELKQKGDSLMQAADLTLDVLSKTQKG